MTARLDWMGCTTFRFVIGELVVFLDAYLDRVPSAAPIGITVEEIDRADWILVGHSHFDHLYGAERIAKATGATIIGSYETVRIMESQGVPLTHLMPVAGGERIRLANDITVAVYPSLHSCLWARQKTITADTVWLGDLGVCYQEQQERMQEVWRHIESLGDEVRSHLQASEQGARNDGGTLLYLVDTPEGSLLYQDTPGYWSGILRDLRPDVAILAAAGRGNIDGEPVQGSLAQFMAREVDLLRPRRVVLCHHDNWLPGFSRAVDVALIREGLARWAPRTTLIEMGYLEAYPIFDGLYVPHRTITV